MSVLGTKRVTPRYDAVGGERKKQNEPCQCGKYCYLVSSGRWVAGGNRRKHDMGFLMIGVMVLLTVAIGPMTLMAASNENERRAIFDEDFGWLTAAGADETLQRIKQAGFNVFVPCIWHGRGTTWPSDLAPKELAWEKVASKNHDPLAYLVQKAHEMDIEVYAWFTVMLRQREFLTQYYDEGTPKKDHNKSFNVHLPEFAEFMVSLVNEVIQRYAVDGVNLDYLRSMGVCVSKYCSENYVRSTGRDLTKDVQAMKRSRTARDAIAQWNRRATEHLLSRVSENVRKLRPKIVLSVDTHVDSDWLKMQGAYSVEWANSGLVDLIYDMNYDDRLDLRNLQNIREKFNDPSMMALLVGNFDRSTIVKGRISSRDALVVKNLVEMASRFGNQGGGLGLYSYKYLSDDQIFQLGARTDPE